MSRPELLTHPADGVQVHASTLLPRSSGVLLAAWFAGPHEGHPGTGIQVLRRNGAESRLTPIAPDDPEPHWNPVLAEGPDGQVWLFYKRGHRIDRWTTWVVRSPDEGLTWSRPAELVPGDVSGGRGPTRQPPLIHRGLWLAPGSVEVWEPPAWDSFIDISPDGGDSWRRVMLSLDHTSVRGAGCIQPCLVELAGGDLVVLTRSTAGRVFRSTTRDPFHWPALAATGLPNNNSGIAAVALPDGRIACLHNDAADDWGARSRLVLSVSADAGISWTPVRTVVDGADVAGSDRPASDGAPLSASATGIVTTGEGEYSYPAMVVVEDRLWASFSWQRQSIALVKLDLP